MTFEAGMSMKTKEHMTICPKIKRHFCIINRALYTKEPVICRLLQNPTTFLSLFAR